VIFLESTVRNKILILSKVPQVPLEVNPRHSCSSSGTQVIIRLVEVYVYIYQLVLTYGRVGVGGGTHPPTEMYNIRRPGTPTHLQKCTTLRHRGGPAYLQKCTTEAP
jgi:hypothetical protein